MNYKVFWSCLVLIGLSIPLARHQMSGQQSEVVARVGEHDITLEDVERKWRELDVGSFMRLSQERYDSLQQFLELEIGDRVLEIEATDRGMSVDTLLQQEMSNLMQPITDQQIASTYTQLQSQMQSRSLDEMREPIRNFLLQRRQVETRGALVKDITARLNLSISTMLDPPRQQVSVADSDPVKGSTRAPVEIVEFSDFQCPFCSRVGPVLEQVSATFGDQVRFVFKDYPLPTHQQAFKAAEAAQCARMQGKFWEYHDTLFAHQSALAVDDLKQYAVQHDLDEETFNACLDSGEAAPLVQQDMAEGNSYGVSSTPAIFINGRLISGAQPFEIFDQIIREELAAQ